MAKETKTNTPAPTATDVPDYTTIVGLKRTKIAELVEEFNDVRIQIVLLEARKKVLAAEGSKILIKVGVRSVMVNELRTTLLEGVSKRISGRKLYELGVSEELIEKATSSTPWTSLKVTEPGENRKGGEE
jgi:hypothetical protein